jgi:hypothetical protein
LSVLVDEKLASLRNERPNAMETQVAHAEAIKRYEGVKAQLESLRDATLWLAQGTTNEKAIETTAKSFWHYVSDWWKKDHQKICNTGYDAALFMSCLGICKLAGGDMTVATVISGALIGGDRVTNALKAAGSLLREKTRRRKGRP